MPYLQVIDLKGTSYTNHQTLEDLQDERTGIASLKAKLQDDRTDISALKSDLEEEKRDFSALKAVFLHAFYHTQN